MLGRRRTQRFVRAQHIASLSLAHIVLIAQVLLHFGVLAIPLYLCHRLAKQSGELSLGKMAKQSHNMRQKYLCDVGLGWIIIAAIRASKRAETKVISDLAAWSESWWQLKSLNQRQFQLAH